MDIFKKLAEIKLPLGEYVVVGSGILAALGLRESNDLDIAVSEKLLQQLIDSGDYEVETRYGKTFLSASDIDILTRLDWEDYSTTALEAIKGAEIINGFPFLNISETIKFKTALGREKDFKDIELLKNYLADKNK